MSLMVKKYAIRDRKGKTKFLTPRAICKKLEKGNFFASAKELIMVSNTFERNEIKFVERIQMAVLKYFAENQFSLEDMEAIKFCYEALEGIPFAEEIRKKYE